MTGTVTGFAAFDAIDFAHSTISSFSVTGDPFLNSEFINVTLGSGQSERITLGAALPSGYSLQVEIDGRGGQELVLVPNGSVPITPNYVWVDGVAAIGARLRTGRAALL